MRKRKTSKRNNFLYWSPRVLGILFIVFLSLFSFDVFSEYSGLELLVALFMHLVPSFVLAVFLIIAWRWENIGGILYIFLGFVFTFFFKTYEDPIVFMLVSFPAFLVGVLFLVNFYRGRK
jgi:hypothetical protein